MAGLLEQVAALLEPETPGQAGRTGTGARMVGKVQAPEQSGEANYLPVIALAVGLVVVLVAVAGNRKEDRADLLRRQQWEQQEAEEYASQGNSYGQNWQ